MDIKLKLNINDLRSISKDYQERLEKAIEEGIKETPAAQIIQEEYDKSDLRVRSGVLYGSFKEEKTADTLKVGTNVDYARIHDVGGYNGPNGTTYQRPKWYFTRATKKIKDFLKAKIKEKMKK